jgi:hypothetical protein
MNFIDSPSNSDADYHSRGNQDKGSLSPLEVTEARAVVQSFLVPLALACSASVPCSTQ